MERNSLPVSLQTLNKWYSEKGTLKFDLIFQRKVGYWSAITKSMLIWSVLTNSYIPPVLLVKADDDIVDDKGKAASVYSVLDGAHRLTTLFSYMNDEFPLHGAIPQIDIDEGSFDIAGKKFSELEQELQNLLNSFKLSIQVLSHATNDELTTLYTNINSGRELSVLSKAKPKLGVELCEYFAKICDMPFISQGLSLSSTQVLKEEDLACCLYGLMLVSDYNDYKSLSLGECDKFAVWLCKNMTDQLKQDFKDIIGYLGVFNARCKYLRKNNVSVIIKLAEYIMLEDIDAQSYKVFLNAFFTSEHEDYKEASGVGNTKLPKVKARYEILARAAEEWFKISILEDTKNSKADEPPSSSEEEAPVAPKIEEEVSSEAT